MLRDYKIVFLIKATIFVLICFLLGITYSCLINSITQEKLDTIKNVEKMKKEIKGLDELSKKPSITADLINDYDQQNELKLNEQLKNIFSLENGDAPLEPKKILNIIKNKESELEKIQNKPPISNIPQLEALIFAALGVIFARIISRTTDYYIEFFNAKLNERCQAPCKVVKRQS